ncbi:hypothetical protein ACHAQH_004435 [Verticillium albo-atrum]
MTGRLQGKTAIVTGAASGFGKGIATKFVAEGANVIIADLSEEQGQVVAKDLGAVFQRADVTKPADWEQLLKLALDKFGHLDLVINNAGATYANKPTEEVTEKDFDLVMNVNVKGVYHSANVLLPYFLENKRPGCFIQVASTAGTRPRPRLTWYNASKAAVINATKTMAVEYGPNQIRFNAVSPVVGSTGMTHLFIGKPDTEENRKGFVSTIPLGRPSTPEDIANSCCYLASDEAAFITGVNIESHSPGQDSTLQDAHDSTETTVATEDAEFPTFDPSFDSSNVPTAHLPADIALQTPESTAGEGFFPPNYPGVQIDSVQRSASYKDKPGQPSLVQHYGPWSHSKYFNHGLSTKPKILRHTDIYYPPFEILIQILSDSKLPPPAQIQDANASRALNDLQRLLNLYFTRFHDIQPILHRPTWVMAECPSVLLTAMACVGALLSDEERDVELSWSLSDICMPMITWLGASDGTYYRDISYLNALCLHQIFSLGSGNRQLYQNADRSRGTLIGSLRGMGLLSVRWNVGEDDSHETTPATDPTHANQEWTAWVSREQERRSAWASFEYDCSLCTLTSRRGAVDLSELPRTLPCAESLWNAPSAQAWLALRSRLGPGSLSPVLSSILKTALVGQDVPIHLGPWAKRLCGQVIGRLLWDLKQLEIVAMPEHFGLTSLLGAHEQSKQSLLGALRKLLESMDTPSTTSELISYNITGLLCHYSHLYAANDVMDVIIYIVRSLTSQNSMQHKGIEVARKRLRSAFAKDAKSGRKLVYHAAQIIAVANEYLVSAPCEIMRAFMGYIFILAYSTYGPRAQLLAGERASLRLDLPDHQPTQKHATLEWIENGGPAGLGSVTNILADGCVPAISRDAQLMMQRLKCWGLAEKFTKILHIFEVNGF